MNREPIAIIGLGCRFPGARDSRSFWELLRDGVDAISTVPPDRWDIEAFYDPDPTADGKMSTRWGGFVENVARFDPLFFGIAPREVTSMDPQQRLLLEVTWEALEDAGQIPERLAGSKTGVFVGLSSYDYYTLLCRDTRNIDAHAGTGNTNCIAANRISYLFDFQGPSMAVDTACSSSLVAVHLACKSLWNGESTLAIAGGVQLVLSPWVTVGYTKSGFMAPDGRCKAFDADANGYVRSEGSGIVVLKPLSKALEDGDRIYALIRGGAVNQDGRSNGLTAPNPAAQDAVLRKAYEDAGVSPSQVTYVEAHGSGTRLGDPIEVKALAAVVGEGRAPENICWLGSVKSNIGHLEAAAGIAGLIKVALSLAHRQIPPSLHFNVPNPYIRFDKLPLRVQQTLQPWPRGAGPMLAGVSSFGFGGTNAHLVLEGAPELTSDEEPVLERPRHVLTLSAKSEGALRVLADRHQEFLAKEPQVALGDLCYSANTGRSAFAHRLAVTAASTAELRERLAAFARGEPVLNVAQAQVNRRKRPKVAFLFTGQGSQYIGMGRELYETQPTFRDALDRCDKILRPHLGQRLLKVLYPPQGEGSSLDDTAYTQPALFSLEYALVELWRSWGIEPTAVMGHSVGELIAACAAGVFRLEDGLRLVAERARLMQALPAGGSMAAIFAPESQVAAAIERYTGVLDIAAINGPESIVVSGHADALGAVVAELEGKGIKSQPLRVSHAFHSPLIEPMLDGLERAARELRSHLPRVPFVSNVTGAVLPEGQVPDAAYWRRHTRAPVRFMEGIRALHGLGCELFLEIGPKPILTHLGARCLPEAQVGWLPSLMQNRGDWNVMLDTLSALYLGGVDINWKGFDRDHPRKRVSLPHYPFERKHYWFKEGNPAVSNQLAGGVVSAPQVVDAVKPKRLESIVTVVRKMVADLLRAAPSELDPQASFLEMGADSISLIEAIRLIESKYQLKLSVRQLFEELTTIDALAAYIERHLPSDQAETPLSPPPVARPVEPEVAAEVVSQPRPEQVAAVTCTVPRTPDSKGTNTVRAVKGVNRLQSLTDTNRVQHPPVVQGRQAFPFGPEGSIDRLFSQQLEIISKQLDLLRSREGASLAPEAGLGVAVPLAVSAGLTGPAEVTRHEAVPARVAAPSSVLVSAPASGPMTVDSRQERYLQSFIEGYTRQTQHSKEWAQKNRPVLSDNRALAGFRMPIKEMSYPIVGSRYRGSRIWDVDGNEYVDLAMGFGVHLFGHGAPFIRQAIEEQLDRGFGIGPQPERAGEVASLFTELTGAERVTFCQSGTEAVMTALRLARTATGRERVVLFKDSFHGHYDGVLARSEGNAQPVVSLAPGTSKGAIRDVVVLDYGEQSAIDYLEAHVHELAAVLVEPVQSRRPELQPRAFLHRVRELTQAVGTALIFDEIVTGFRIQPGGAQAHFGIQADLATYGKILGGGLPLAAVAGNRRFMDGIDGGQWSYGDQSYPEGERTFFAGTFNKPPLSLATALAVLKHLKERGPELQDELNARTACLAATLNGFFNEQQVPAQVVYFGSLFRFVLKGNLDLFFHHLIAKGVYVWEGRTCFLSTAHTEADVAHIIQAVKSSVEDLRRGGFLPEPPSSRRRSTAPSEVAVAPAVSSSSECAGSSVEVLTREPGAEQPRAEFWDRRRFKSATAPHVTPDEELKQAPLRSVGARKELEFSLYYFGKYEAAYRDDKYDLLLEGARYADAHGFSAIWVPERHFHPFGGFSPNPSVICAALARETKHLKLRAGSVVVPLHHPLRIAEEWAVVDNLSKGRVGMSVASGWHPDDFVFAPDAYGNHRELMFQNIETIRRLWRGESLRTRGGGKQEIDVRCFPMPMQSELPLWVTIVNNPETYVRAGQIGAGVLTNLMGQSREDLARNIALYRKALEEAGHDPVSGHVTVLMHTFVGEELETVRNTARGPFCEYLAAHFTLFQNLAKSQGLPVDLNKLTEDDKRYMLSMAYDRYVRSSALIGTPDSCAEILDGLRQIGVDEVACFVDFGVDARSVMAALPSLVELKDRYRQTGGKPTPKASPEQEIVVPLTEGQREMLTRVQMSTDDTTAGVHQAVGVRLRGSLNLEALRRAVEQVVSRHEALRTTLDMEGECQHIWPPMRVDVPLVDMTAAGGGKTLSEWFLEESRTPFKMDRAPLLRAHLLQLGEREYVLSLRTHHILCDGQSMSIILHEVGELYAAYSKGKDCVLAPPMQFREYVAWQERHARSAEMQSHEEYWRQHLVGALPVLELPLDRPRPPVKTYRAQRQTSRVDAELLRSLRGMACEHGCTPFMATLATYLLLLHRLSGQADIIVGIPSSGRSAMGSGGLVGHCANLLPIRSNLPEGGSFADFLARTRGVLLEAYEHQAYPFARLVSGLELVRDPSIHPLVTVVFNLDRPVSVLRMGDLEADWVSLPVDYAIAETSLNGIEVNDSLVLEWGYNQDLFDATTLERMQRHFQSLLEQVVVDPRRPLASLSLIEEEERRRLLVEWNDTRADFRHDVCIHQAFEEQVTRTPEALAVASGERHLTYAQLSTRANQLAHHLRSLGVGPEVPVGLCMERSVEMVVGLLGILKAGGAYVPLDPAYPAERIHRILGDASAPVLVTQRSLAERLPAGAACVVCVDVDRELIDRQPSSAPPVTTRAEHLAYVIYTSGSTGAPRGVMVQHRSVMNLVEALRRAIYTNLPDQPLRVSLNGPLAFDTSVKQLIQLLSGHALDVVPETLRLDGVGLLQWLRERRVDVLDCTPSQLDLLTGAGLLAKNVTHPRAVLVGGEALNSATWDALARASHLQFYNVYGPTECTVDATVARVEASRPRPVIGLPLANVQAYVLDAWRQPLPVGAVGELCLGGAGLARGYWRRPELTVERFVPHPFGGPGERLYCTGDLVRRLPDGALEFVGRMDGQVKIRGFRVEPGEIESALQLHPAISQSVVLVQQRAPGDVRLVAFVVPAVGDALDVKELRRHLRGRLPDYMMPATFVPLERMPLSPHGKVDRTALSRLGAAQPDLKDEYVAPRTPVESQLVKIWEDVLGFSPIGVTSSFFHLGGHSLLAVRMLGLVHQQLGQNLPLSDVLDEPTIEHVAQIIQRNNSWAGNIITRHQAQTRNVVRSSLVRIRPGGSRPPIFFAPPMGGIFPATVVIGILDLAQHLPPDQPFYGLQAAPLEPELAARSRHESVPADWRYDRRHFDNIVEELIRALQEVYPEGPCYLGGFCSGSLLALEMAVRLRQRGRQVAHVVLIDPPIGEDQPQLQPTPMPDVDPEVGAMTWFLARDIGWQVQWDLREFHDALRPLSSDDRWELGAKRLLGAGCVPPQTTSEDLRWVFESKQANQQVTMRVLYCLEPQRYEGKVTLLFSEHTREGSTDEAIAEAFARLRQHMVGQVELHFIPGNHGNLFRAPQVGELVAHVNRCLGDRGCS